MREPRDVTQSGWVSRIAALQDREGYSEQHWEGTFDEYLALVKQNPKVTRTAFQRVYDMILSYGKTEYIDNKKKLIRYNFFNDPDERREGRHLRPRHPAHAARERLQERGAGLRHREARHPAARPGRLLQVHHRAAAQEGARGVLADRRGRALHLRLGRRADQPRRAEAPRGDALPDARGAAAPHPARVARPACYAELCAARVRVRHHRQGELCPACRFVFTRADDGVQGRLGEGDAARRACGA